MSLCQAHSRVNVDCDYITRVCDITRLSLELDIWYCFSLLCI